MLGLLKNPAIKRRLIATELIVVPVGVALLFYLLVDSLPFVRLSDALGAVALSFVLALAGYAAFAYRLGYVLRAFAIPIATTTVWRVHLTSLFYYFFLPAGIGYDFSKVAKIALRAPQQKTWRIAGAIAAERLVGGAGVYLLLLLTLPFTQFTPDAADLDWLMLPWWAWPVLVAVAVLAAYAIAVWARHGGAYRPRLFYPAVITSAIAHLLVAGAIWYVGHSLLLPINPAEVVVALAGTLLFQLIPFNLLGVSLGEVAAVAIYLAYGLPKSEALLLTTVAYTQRLVPALVGGAVEAAGAMRELRGALATRAGTRSGLPDSTGVPSETPE